MTADQAALLRKAHSSLHAAKLLAGEKFFDFSVSRAYYTMFYVAEALLLGQGRSFSKHSAVLAAFGEHLASRVLCPCTFTNTCSTAKTVAMWVTMILVQDYRMWKLTSRSVERRSSWIWLHG